MMPNNGVFVFYFRNKNPQKDFRKDLFQIFKKSMADLQGIRKNITEMALVCTEKQFANLCAADANMLKREYVRLDAKQVRGELCGGVALGEMQPDSVAVIPFGCSAHYLSFLLCSLPGQLLLFGQKFNVLAKTTINKKAVSTLTVFDVSNESEETYAMADLLRQEIYNFYREKTDDMDYQRLYGLITDLCDVLALELYAHPLFEEKGVFILENWKAVLVKDTTKDKIAMALTALTDSSSPLRNEIMKAHILVQDVNDYIKK